MPKNDSESSKRRHDLDNLRTFLTALVIYHHTAVVYGGSGSWLFKSRFFNHGSVALALFNATNQSFFMGLFFWLSGFLSGKRLSNSPTKESRFSFLRNKCLHLGLPAAIYTLIIHPLSMVLASNLGLGISMSGIKTTLFSHNYWRNLRGVRGPVWYLATLLSFDTLATLCIPYTRLKVIQYSQKLVSSRIGIPLLWLSSTALTFFLRIFWPVGTTLPLIAVQPAYLPQYILAYKLGFLSSITGVPNLLTPLNKNGALKDNAKSSESNIQAQDSRDTSLFDQSPAIPIALSYFSLPLIFYRIILSRPKTRSWVQLDPLSFISGGLTVPAFLYVIWNEMSFALIGPRLLVHFSRFYNYCVKNTSPFHSRYSYAAFLVHTPIIILMGVGADRLLALIAKDRDFNNRFGRMLMPVIMTATVGTGNVLGSFAVGKFLVDYVPGVGQII